MRIWAKSGNGRIHIATGYDGMPASISKPTDGFVVDHNNVGIGNFSTVDPSEKLHVIGNIKATGSITVTGGNSTNWNTAYGWGNHGSAGYAASSHTHAASDITSGTLATARIPSLAASKITSGTFADARIPSLAASLKLTSPA